MKNQKDIWNAGLYDQKHSFVFKYGEDLLELLNPKKGERILDVGCGTGHLTHKIAELGAEVAGIDSSPAMIEEAKKNFPTIDFEVADVRSLAFSEKFDAIFSNATLHWVKDGKEEAIVSMYKSLKPGGRLVVEFGGKDNVNNIVEALKNTFKRKGYKNNAEIDFWYYPSIGEYSSLLERHGFRVTKAFHFDRDTELSDSEKGIIDWLNMFGKNFFENISEEEKQEIFLEVQKELYNSNFKDGKWFADYKRLRISAWRINK